MSREDAPQSMDASPESLFFQSILAGHFAVANCLLQGLSANCTNAKGQSGLHVSAKRHQNALFKSLLEKDADPKLADIKGKTPLMCAAGAGNGDIVRLLLDKTTVDVGRLTKSGQPAVFFALRSGHVEIAEVLEAKNKCLHLLSEDCRTSILEKAVEADKACVVKFLSDTSCLVSDLKLQQLALKACKLGRTELLQYFPVDFDQPVENGNSPLCCAVGGGFDGTVKYMIDKGCDVGANRECVKVAVKSNRLEVLKLLRSHGAHLDESDEGLTPLQRAIFLGSVEMFQYLLDEGCSTNGHPEFGSLALIAARERKIEILRFLVMKKHPSIHEADPLTGETPLLAVCEKGPIEAAKLLIDGGCDCNAQNKTGVTPALRAANHRQDSILMLLKDNGAKLDIPDHLGVTPIMCAGKKRSLAMVRYLADVNPCSLKAKDSEGKTLAHIAAEDKNVGLLKFLQDKRIPLDEPDNNGLTPLMTAFKECDDNSMLIVEQLACGPRPSCNFNQRDCMGRTAAQAAVTCGRLDLVQYLKDNGADLATIDCDGNTLLLEAAQVKGSDRLMKYLMKSGTDLHATNNEQRGAMHYACMQQDNQCLVSLLDDKAPHDIQDRMGETPFMISSKRGNESHILMLKSIGVDVNKRTKSGLNASHMAAQSGNLNVLHSFALFNCALDQEDCRGITPLIFACSGANDLSNNCWPDMAKFLIEKGADPNAITHSGRSPVHFACEFGSIELVQLLHERGADLNVQDESLVTPFMLAAKTRSKPLLEFLCASGCPVNAMDAQKRTALHYAVAAGNSPVVKFLVKKGLDPCQTDESGMSPVLLSIKTDGQTTLKELREPGRELQEDFTTEGNNASHFACRNKDLALLKELQSKGVSLSCPNKAGDNCLTIACSVGSAEIVNYLLEQSDKPYIHHKNESGDTALILAAKYRHLYLIPLLLEHEANPLQSDKSGNNALHIVCSPANAHDTGGSVDPATLTATIKELLDHGAKVDEVNGEDKTALHLACQAGDLSSAELLIEKESRLDWRDKDGETPLFGAIRSGSHDLVRLLLTRGASPDVQNEQGVSAVLTAVALNDKRLFELLSKDTSPQIDASLLRDMNVFDSLFRTRNLNHLDFLLKRGFDASKIENGITLLHHTVLLGDERLLKLLVDRACTEDYAFLRGIVDSQDTHGNTPLHLSIKRGRLDLAALLMKLDCKTDLRNAKGFTVLHVAVNCNKLSLVEWLFETVRMEVNANSVEPLGVLTPLQLAAIRGSTAVFQYLEGKGYSASQRCSADNNCAHLAAGRGNVHILKHLEKGDRSVLENKNGNGLTPLQCAVLNGQESAAELLYYHVESALSEDSVLLAVQRGHQHMVEWLRKRGAKLNVSDEATGETSLWHAFGSGNFHLVKSLLEAREAPPLSVKTKHEDSLAQAAALGSHLHLLRLLKSKEAPLDDANMDGNTPIMECAQLGKLASLRLLHSHGCNLGRVNAMQRSSVHLACIGADGQQQHLDILQYIRDQGLSLDAADGQENTGLMYASHFGKIKLVDFLLDSSDWNKANSNGTTAAHLAARAGHANVLESLASKGANLDTQDASGTTPLMLAVHFNRVSCVAFLVGKNFAENATNASGWSLKSLAAFASGEVRTLLEKQVVELDPIAPAAQRPPDCEFGFEINTELCSHQELRRRPIANDVEEEEEQEPDFDDQVFNPSEPSTNFGLIPCTRHPISAAASTVS